MISRESLQYRSSTLSFGSRDAGSARRIKSQPNRIGYVMDRERLGRNSDACIRVLWPHQIFPILTEIGAFNDRPFYPPGSLRFSGPGPLNQDCPRPDRKTRVVWK